MDNLNLYVIKDRSFHETRYVLITRYGYEPNETLNYGLAEFDWNHHQFINRSYFYEEYLECRLISHDMFNFELITDFNNSNSIVGVNQLNLNFHGAKYKLSSLTPNLLIHPRLENDLAVLGYGVEAASKVSPIEYSELINNLRVFNDSILVTDFLRRITPELFI